MATRPIFVPAPAGQVGANDFMVAFDWHPGMAPSQKLKSIQSLHESAKVAGYESVLEISSKSALALGATLSAFNLLIETQLTKQRFTVETAFQGSKVFERGGPFRDLIGMDSRAAKGDIRLKESGNLLHFDFFGRIFPLKPRTFFYDWLYINALALNKSAGRSIMHYDAFSDIEFNPTKSINCQARSAAIFVSLSKSQALEEALRSPDSFLKVLADHYLASKHEGHVQGTIL